MGRHRKEIPDMPTEIGEIEKLVTEFMRRYDNIDNELEILKEDKKQLIEEFSDRLDMKTMQQAIRTVKIRKKVDKLDTYETIVEILDKRECI
jgi:hypothetical protein